MKGTAVLFQDDQTVTFLENVDRSVFEEIKKQCGCENCNCKIENKTVEFGSISPVFWCQDEVDWDYGY
ncbi:hypothetical protein H1Z61_17265 [Bacillus aquiflavi]|uniref:Uncharacterized protein n=1 Tax=Bacillus aquiflavi TaxID=2672567 RepID=A0A6B3W5F1_9BACI|nr:hypothetical protein [Bacillus aquiflavi]MBA4538824.1 hypothetical protein [Bacillus aquiflavi]NEY83183.1 hypothetical protein [Bacillus aquiflavi]